MIAAASLPNPAPPDLGMHSVVKVPLLIKYSTLFVLVCLFCYSAHTFLQSHLIGGNKANKQSWSVPVFAWTKDVYTLASTRVHQNSAREPQRRIEKENECAAGVLGCMIETSRSSNFPILECVSFVRECENHHFCRSGSNNNNSDRERRIRTKNPPL